MKNTNNTHHGGTETRSTSKFVEPSVTGGVIGAAIEVHRQLGAGLLTNRCEDPEEAMKNTNNTHRGGTETRSTSKLVEPSVTGGVIGAAIEVHRQLGAGLLESVYEECLCEELRERAIPFVRQPDVPLVYKGRPIATTFRIDLVVAETVVVELKSVEQLLPVHEAQLLTYMKLTGKHIGLLINFNVPLLSQGIVRRVL